MGGSRRLRVLVVEDEALLALDLGGVVERLDHRVVGFAATAEEALSLSALHCPDVALVDVRLGGGVDGTALAVELRERDDVRALFLTAFTDPATRDRAQAAWPLGLIGKPVHPDALAAALAAAAGLIGERRRVAVEGPGAVFEPSGQRAAASV